MPIRSPRDWLADRSRVRAEYYGARAYPPYAVPGARAALQAIAEENGCLAFAGCEFGRHAVGQEWGAQQTYHRFAKRHPAFAFERGATPHKHPHLDGAHSMSPRRF